MKSKSKERKRRNPQSREGVLMPSPIFKDPYVFDFLGTADPLRKAELKQKLVDHLEKFLLELGQGVAFVGRQVHIEVGGDDFYIDLLFYHFWI